MKDIELTAAGRSSRSQARLRLPRPRLVLGAVLGSVLAWPLLSAAALAQNLFAGGDEYAQLIFEVATLDSDVSDRALTREPDSTTDINDAAPALEDLRSLASLEASVDDAMAAEGLYSPLLREAYQQLGSLQQRLGQHESAVATLEKSVHIARVNDGLSTLDQEADVQRIIENLQALGDSDREADYRGYLYYLQQRAYADDDPRLIDARIAWADWNLQKYQQSALLDPRSIQLPGGERMEDLVVIRDQRSGQIRFIPRRMLLGATAMPDALSQSAQYSLTPEMVIDTRLRTARDLYKDLLADASVQLTPEQRERLQLQLASAEYTLKWQMDELTGTFDASSMFAGAPAAGQLSPPMVRRGFAEIRNRFDEDILALEREPVSDPLALSTAYLRQADLHIAYESRQRAEDWYVKAWNTLLAAGLDAAAAGEWLQPVPLQPVPDYAVHQYSRELFGISPDDTLPYRGYIDVELNLTRDGNVRRASITEASTDTPQRVRSKLLTYLRNQKMRPRLEQGSPVTTEDLQLRFYYSY